MFRPASSDTFLTLYTLYKETQHPHYFRHFPPGLPFNVFQALFQMSIPYEILHNNTPAGVINVSLNNLTRNADIGLLLYTPHQHQDLALKAMLKQASILFKHHTHKLICSTSSSDTRSIALLEKGGFIKEATLRDFSFYNNHYHDELRYVLPFKRYKRLYQ